MNTKKALLFLGLVILLVIAGFSIRLPGLGTPQPSVLYDVNGKVINGLTEKSTLNVSLEEISPYFTSAVIAVEDKNFRKHYGIDFWGIVRATYINIKSGRIVEGGSTITQQTAKNLYLSNEKTFSRKIKELYYAILLERRYSKDEILTIYCNTIYFGEGAYGVEAAARTFFGKKASDLDLAQASLLAGLPQWPSNYDPYVNPEKAKARQKIVLERMQEEKQITAAQQQAAWEEPLHYQEAAFAASEAPYFVDMVRDYLTKKYGERMIYQGGLQIYTSLDLDMQTAANQAVQNGMANRSTELQTALVAVDTETAEIRALVGGRKYKSSQLNHVYALRQPGSTFKPFLYSLAVEQGRTAADMIMCEEVEYHVAGSAPYRPADYGDEPYHWKDFTLKEAIMISDNVVAVRLNDELGPNNTAAHAEKFGFVNINPVLSLPLGSNEVRPIDMAAAYAVFANGGFYSAPHYLLKIEDQNNTLLEEYTPKKTRIITEVNASIITNLLTGVLETGGTGASLKARVGRPAAAKTGTTDEYKDAWFVGFTPQLSCAVWVGYDKNQAVNLPGSVAAGPIWADFIKAASAKLPEMDFIPAAEVTTVPICLDSGQIATEYCPRTSETAFEEGTEPEDLCPVHMPEEFWNINPDKTPENNRRWWQFW